MSLCVGAAYRHDGYQYIYIHKWGPGEGGGAAQVWGIPTTVWLGQNRYGGRGIDVMRPSQPESVMMMMLMTLRGSRGINKRKGGGRRIGYVYLCYTPGCIGMGKHGEK